MFRIFILLVLLFTVSCAKGQGISLRTYREAGENPSDFWICHGFSCSYKTRMGFEKQDWQALLAHFNPPARTAEEERRTIAMAVRNIERYINQNSGLHPDQGKAETFEKDEDQMDCVDETINTSLYLKFLDEAGVFRFHEFAQPVHRGYLVNGMWPHNSAAVREISTGVIYVIDSYYYDSGEKIAVVPFDTWLADWHPADVPRD